MFSLHKTEALFQKKLELRLGALLEISDKLSSNLDALAIWINSI